MSTGEHISTRFFVKEKVSASTAYSFRTNNNISLTILRPPLWSSGQSFWLQIQRSRVRFPALPDFSESTQPREPPEVN